MTTPAAATNVAKKGFGHFMNQVGKVSAIAGGGGAGGSVAGYIAGRKHGKERAVRQFQAANDIENQAIAQEFFNRGVEAVNTKTATVQQFNPTFLKEGCHMSKLDILDSVYENAFVDELEKIAGGEAAEAGKKALPFMKKVLEGMRGGAKKAWGGVKGGASELKRQYKSMGGELASAKHNLKASFAKDNSGFVAQNFRKNALSNLARSVTKNPAAAAVTGAGVLGLGGGGTALAMHAGKKKD
jgi:hypothetical protein